MARRIEPHTEESCRFFAERYRQLKGRATASRQRAAAKNEATAAAFKSPPDSYDATPHIALVLGGAVLSTVVFMSLMAGLGTWIRPSDRRAHDICVAVLTLLALLCGAVYHAKRHNLVSREVADYFRVVPLASLDAFIDEVDMAVDAVPYDVSLSSHYSYARLSERLTDLEVKHGVYLGGRAKS